MEVSMSGNKTIARTIAAAGICTALTIGVAQAAQDAYFVDALKPNGHERSLAEKYADARACGATNGGKTVDFMPALEKCMSAKGWTLSHYAPDKAASPKHGTTVNFIDVIGDSKGHGRSDAALQSDGRACRGAGDQESTAFKACMAGRGWQYTVTEYGPPPPRLVQQARQNAPWSGWVDNDSPTYVDHDSDLGRGSIDQQAASDAINAASQATIDGINAMNRQFQNDAISANAPTPP
jgi:hypothetical protein